MDGVALELGIPQGADCRHNFDSKGGARFHGAISAATHNRATGMLARAVGIHTLLGVM